MLLAMIPIKEKYTEKGSLGALLLNDALEITKWHS